MCTYWSHLVSKKKHEYTFMMALLAQQEHICKIESLTRTGQYLWYQYLWHLRNWIFNYHLTVHCGISTKTYNDTMACTQSVLVSTTHITIELSNAQARYITIECSITVNFYKWRDNNHSCACLLLRSCFDVVTCLWARYFVMKCTQHTCNMQLPRVTGTQQR